MRSLDYYNRDRFCEYHSHQWELLVEAGWITWTVDELPDGTQIARMKWGR